MTKKETTMPKPRVTLPENLSEDDAKVAAVRSCYVALRIPEMGLPAHGHGEAERLAYERASGQADHHQIRRGIRLGRRDVLRAKRLGRETP